jgi:1-acyl-sn-glycerol-3-phosphate acyltransferase
MQRTVFNTPLVKRALHGLSLAWLRLSGWQIEGALPPEAAKSVLIAAPHTSNWDLPYTLMAGFALRLNLVWLGKASLFRWPFGGLMRWLGGMPVQRDQRNNLVAASAAVIRAAAPPFQLIIPAEGTRGRTRHWKTGFYFIALQAQVPIVLAYMDYAQRRAGLGPIFQPSGEFEADMARIKGFYAGVQGRRPGAFEN